jgi:hypothetical protein
MAGSRPKKVGREEDNLMKERKKNMGRKNDTKKLNRHDHRPIDTNT